MQKITTHREQSRIFLAQAYDELAKGDSATSLRERVGSRGANAEGHQLTQRGWSNSRHRDIYLELFETLRLETGDPQLSVQFQRRLFSSRQLL